MNYINDGPLIRIILCDPKISSQLFTASERKSVLDSNIRELKQDIRKNISEPMHGDKLFFYKYKLWVWFLSEPNKLVHAIKEVKDAAAKKESPAYNSISGIMCKRNE